MLPVIESYFSVFMLFGFSQAVLSIYLLIRAREKPFANNLLALLLFTWGFSCYWFFAFINRGYLFSVTVTTMIGPMLALTLFPPVFLYVKYAVRSKQSFECKDHLHFLPIYLYIIFTLYLFVDSNFSIATMRRQEWFGLRRNACAYLATFQGPFYYWKSRQLLARHKKLQSHHGATSGDFAWLQPFNYGFVVIFTIGGLSTFFRYTPFDPYVLYMVYHAVIASGIMYITVVLIKNPRWFAPLQTGIQPLLATVPAETPQRFLHNAIQPEEKSAPVSFLSNKSAKRRNSDIDRPLLIKINTVMRDRKLYTNPDLKLNDLADATGESRNTISAVLNNSLHKTFYEYLNELRVEESKKLLADRTLQHYSVEGLAAMAGFKTMSVFYRLFKESEKVTPAVYRRRGDT